jgi:hypothetical protein
MRTRLMVAAALIAVLAVPANAQDSAAPSTDRYYAELSNQCPGKQLQLLSPADLRDGLDDFIASLSSDTQAQLRRAERTQCSSMDAGAACVNTADIGAADQLGQSGALAASICSAFLRCRTQSDCDHAR